MPPAVAAIAPALGVSAPAQYEGAGVNVADWNGGSDADAFAVEASYDGIVYASIGLVRGAEGVVRLGDGRFSWARLRRFSGDGVPTFHVADGAPASAPYPGVPFGGALAVPVAGVGAALDTVNWGPSKSVTWDGGNREDEFALEVSNDLGVSFALVAFLVSDSGRYILDGYYQRVRLVRRAGAAGAAFNIVDLTSRGVPVEGNIQTVNAVPVAVLNLPAEFMPNGEALSVVGQHGARDTASGDVRWNRLNIILRKSGIGIVTVGVQTKDGAGEVSMGTVTVDGAADGAGGANINVTGLAAANVQHSFIVTAMTIL